MIVYLLQIFCFLLVWSIESRHVTDQQLKWPESRSQYFDKLKKLFQNGNSRDLVRRPTVVEGLDPRNVLTVERTEVTVDLKVERETTKTKTKTEIQEKAELKVTLEKELQDKVEIVSGPKPDMKVTQEKRSKPEVRFESGIRSKPGLESKPEMRIKPEVEAKPEMRIKPEVRANPKVEAKPELVLLRLKRDASDYKIKTYKVTMSTKNAQPYVPLSIGTKEYQALVDSGSGMSLISRKLFEQLKTNRQAMTYKDVLKTCQVQADNEKMTIKQVANIPFQISRFPVTFPFFVADGLQMDLLLGYDFMVQSGAVIDFRSNLFTSNLPKVGCRTILEKVASACCLLAAFDNTTPKTHEVKFVRGKPLTVLPVTIGGTHYEALLDSASAVSLISARYVKILTDKRQIEKTEKASASVVIGAQVSTLTERALIRVKIGSSTPTIAFFIAPSMPVDLIIGYDFMTANKAVLDYKTGSFVFQQTAAG